MQQIILKCVRTLLLLYIGGLFVLPAHAQMYIDGVPVYNNTVIYCQGDFTNTASAQWLNNDSLSITGKITNHEAAMNPLLGFTEFIGTINQSVNGLQPFIGYNVKFSNALGVTLNQILQVNNNGTFNSGIVTALVPNVPMVFGPAGVPVGAKDASHVNGVVRTLLTGGTFTYPVGNGSLYRKIAANITSNASGLDGQYFMADAGPNPFTTNGTEAVRLVAYFPSEYWNLKRVSTAVATLTVYYDQVVPAVITNTAHLRVAHRTDAEWRNEGIPSGAVGTILQGSVTSNLLSTEAQWSPMASTWSPITLGSINILSPLPLTLLSFTVTKQGSAALLHWTVAEQVNTSHFDIERSPDGLHWLKIGSQKAAGNYAGSLTYQFTDAVPNNGMNYYRLKMVDIDGRFTYSDVRPVVFDVQVITVLPNPARERIYIKGANIGAVVCIIDVKGRLLQTHKLTDAAMGIDISGLASAVYFVQVIENNKVVGTARIIKD